VAGCKRLLRKSSSEAPTATADEMDVSEDHGPLQMEKGDKGNTLIRMGVSG